jgi:hypothetical protein
MGRVLTLPTLRSLKGSNPMNAGVKRLSRGGTFVALTRAPFSALTIDNYSDYLINIKNEVCNYLYIL